MEFNFIKNQTIPRSAWLAHIKKDQETIDLYHGASVEVQDDFFVEGAWSGDFKTGDFDEAVTFLGSGGKSVDGQTVVFSAPSHIYERLFALRVNRELFVSNSLVFLLSASGEDLDEEYPHYAKALYRTFGNSETDKSIPTKAKNRIQQFYYVNLTVRRGLEIIESPKKEVEGFTDFNSYTRFLETSIAEIIENANDPRRNVPYHRPISLLSTGYDSTATSVLAKRIGCTETLTFKEARPLDIDHYYGGSDSGKMIAESLGMNCKEIDRLDYLRSDRRFPEAEIFVTAHFVDLYALSLENWLNENCILFTGFRGDIMWNKHLDENQDSGGPGIAEFRLRKGFLHFPLPYLGTHDCRPAQCRVSKSVRRISNTTEMLPWSVGGDYDRPIPRRIVEEAGIDRESFAQTKKAVAVWYGKEAPQDIMKRDSYQDYQAFRCKVKGSEVNQGIHWGIVRIRHRYEM